MGLFLPGESATNCCRCSHYFFLKEGESFIGKQLLERVIKADKYHDARPARFMALVVR